MLVLVILGVPLLSFLSVWMGIYFGPVQKPLTVDLIGLTLDLLSLLFFALLGAYRIRTLVAASFIFSILYVTEIPLIYYMGAIVFPLLNVSNIFETFYHFPILTICEIIIKNIILMCCCFLSAHWLRKTKVCAPRNLSILFSCFFLFFTTIILFWWKDIVMIIPVSFLASALVGTLLVSILILAFYFYTLLISQPIVTTLNFTEFIPKLSKRELEVIEAVLAGFVSHKELADSLNISINTVKTHLKHIYEAVGVSSIDALSLIFHGFTPNHPKITPKSPLR